MSRILIVEDDLAILSGLKANLEFDSHQIFTATDGEAGYRSICDNAPDLVILDLMLPKLNGYDLCKRARGEGFRAPIMMLSARSVESDRVMGLDLGANDYITKPFSLRELLARVRAQLRHEQERDDYQEILDQDLKMASRVQQELFPRTLPAVAGLDYAGVCCPARGVSGDYYDFLPLDDGKLGLLLADVSGKGISAALLGASLHAAIRAHAYAAGERCGELIAKVNGILFETTTADRYATMFYGVYDATTRRLSYANAGHCPPMIVRGSADCIRLDSLTMPAGLRPTLAAVYGSVQLLQGDWLLVFSDGIPEAINQQGDDFGDDKLLAALSRLRGGTSAEMCEGILKEVRDHTRGERQADDLTLIAARIL